MRHLSDEEQSMLSYFVYALQSAPKRARELGNAALEGRRSQQFQLLVEALVWAYENAAACPPRKGKR